MSHAPSSVTKEDVEKIITAAPFAISPRAKIIFWLFLLIGVVGFVSGINGEHSRTTWAAFLVNFFYWFMAACASAGFSAVFHICNAQWARPLRRLYESTLPYIFLSLIPFGILILGHRELYSWAVHPLHSKELWMKPVFVFARDAAAMLILGLIIRAIVRHSVRRDLLAIRGGLTGVSADKCARWNGKFYEMLIGNVKGDAKAEIARSTHMLGRLSPITVMLYAWCISLLSWDLIMSIDPHWYSTMFGGFIFMSAVYLAMAFMALRIWHVRELHPLFREKFERRTLWDQGKLLFGFGIFWAYLFWAHYLPIWYGNMPEETQWVILRLRDLPWRNLAWFILGCSFIVPFFLGMSRDVKQVPILLWATGAIVAIGQWLQLYLLIVPTLYPDQIPLNWDALWITLGFMGAFVLSSVYFLERVPLIPFGDFYGDD